MYPTTPIFSYFFASFIKLMNIYKMLSRHWDAYNLRMNTTVRDRASVAHEYGGEPWDDSDK